MHKTKAVVYSLVLWLSAGATAAWGGQAAQVAPPKVQVKEFNNGNPASPTRALYLDKPDLYISRYDATTGGTIPPCLPGLVDACTSPVVRLDMTNSSTSTMPTQVGLLINGWGYRASNSYNGGQVGGYATGEAISVFDARTPNTTSLTGLGIVTGPLSVPTRFHAGSVTRQVLGIELDINNSTGVDSVWSGQVGNYIVGLSSHMTRSATGDGALGFTIGSESPSKGWKVGEWVSKTKTGISINERAGVGVDQGIVIQNGGSYGLVVGSGTVANPVPLPGAVAESPTIGILLDATGAVGSPTARSSNTLVFRSTDSALARHEAKVAEQTDRTLRFQQDGVDSFVVGPGYASVTGNLGIGVSNPRNILAVARGSRTQPIADAWTTYSSLRWKTDIRPIEGALDKVERLRGVYFDWTGTSRHDLGLVAEEVGKVVPEVVTYEDNGKDAVSLDYGRLTSLLVEAIKEQQTEIKQLKSELEQLRERVAESAQVASK